LLHEIAEATLKSRAFDQFVVPRLGQIAKPLGSDITDVSLMRRIGDGGIETAQFLTQFVTERRIRANFSQRFRTIPHQVRHMGQRVKHAVNSDPHRFDKFRHLVSPKIVLGIDKSKIQDTMTHALWRPPVVFYRLNS
jgi:hypothetical protein